MQKTKYLQLKSPIIAKSVHSNIFNKAVFESVIKSIFRLESLNFALYYFACPPHPVNP